MIPQIYAVVIYGPVGPMSRNPGRKGKDGVTAVRYLNRALSRYEVMPYKLSQIIYLPLFMTDAAYPAPNPLSMFTTRRPLEQEFSIPIRAATPLRPVP